MIRVDGQLALLIKRRFKWFGVFVKAHRVFCDFFIAKETIPQNLVAYEYIARARKMFAFDVTKADVVCSYWLVLFVYVTVS